jgi:hypothetical protein
MANFMTRRSFILKSLGLAALAVLPKAKPAVKLKELPPPCRTFTYVLMPDNKWRTDSVFKHNFVL